MTTRVTLFRAVLVQDSALSVSGVDRESTANQPFAVVDGVPTLVGRGLKGAAVAMARRFFDPLPRSISEAVDQSGGYRRSAWEFPQITPTAWRGPLRARAGVGIRHNTGARAHRVLYDREVVPAGTRWPLEVRVDWGHAGAEAAEVEGILGYVLEQHWKAGRCWLGGGVARGLGWCHLEDLRAFRLDEAAWEQWVGSRRKTLPKALPRVPMADPTHGWCLRTLDLDLVFGEHRPDPDGPVWGVDMLSVAPHDSERSLQPMGDGLWARPAWADSGAPKPDALNTDRALLMEGDRPVLPGSSLRGALRHAFSRSENAAGRSVEDPHVNRGEVSDLGGEIFGTVSKSSRVLIRDGRAEAEWAAARLHMHAEDEFSAGSYGSAKRDAVRLLRGTFPMRIVVEGKTALEVEPLVQQIDGLVALGALGHLPVGGHKTRGAGWGKWVPQAWQVHDVAKVRDWSPLEVPEGPVVSTRSGGGKGEGAAWRHWRCGQGSKAWIRVVAGQSTASNLRELGLLAQHALKARALVAWWGDPAIDLDLARAVAVFGRSWPEEETKMEEVAFFADDAVWRMARTASGVRWLFIEEVAAETAEAREVEVVFTPARLHGSTRFAAASLEQRGVQLRQWQASGETIGFTLAGGR